MELKLYAIEIENWDGAFIAIATSEDEARSIFTTTYPDYPEEIWGIYEHDIKKGLLLNYRSIY